MLWLNFLHFYQPANAEFYNIRKALDKSYWRLIRLLEENPNLRFTLNVSGCLLERLAEEKETAWLNRLKFLVKTGRAELTGSAAYHGLLPLLPEAEAGRQIRSNAKILKKHFGKNFQPAGFFLPEMAYSPAVARLVRRLGYRWIILDEIAYGGGMRRPEPGRVYADAASGLLVIFRNRELSNSYPPDKLLPLFKTMAAAPAAGTTAAGAVVTATDAELYGLRHEDPTGELEKIVKIKGLKTATISHYLAATDRKKITPVNLVPSSWESGPAEIRRGRPYQLWQDKSNKIQVDLWRLANLALALGEKFKGDKNFYWYRWHLVRGLASCTFWWASARDFSRLYGPYAWSPDEIERGLEDLIRAVRSLANPRTKKYKLAAEKYYRRVKERVWQAHWQKHWQKTI
jgi:alpha-amylase/alpha-mannosidase (GH57 family)